MSPRVAKLALIGAGRWGANIRRTLLRIPGCRLTYVETHRWKYLESVKDLDGVLIATPGSTHAAIALPFIERGIPTFIEKPLTVSLREALALQRTADRSRAIVFVGHVHLYNPAYVKTKDLARKAGRIRYLCAESMNNGPFRDDLSVLWDWAPHDLAMTLDLLDCSPIAVQACALSTLRPKTKLHDAATLHLRFPGGTDFFGLFGWLSPEKRKRLTIVGERDTIVFDDTAERKVTLYRGLGPTVHWRTVTRREPNISYPAYSPEPPLKRELEMFLQCIRTGEQPQSNLALGLAVVRILEAAERSIRHREVLIPLKSLELGKKTHTSWP